MLVYKTSVILKQRFIVHIVLQLVNSVQTIYKIDILHKKLKLIRSLN